MTENLTALEIPRSSARMARPKNEFEKVLLRLKPGTNDRIDAVRGERDRASFVREAIDEKVDRETRAQARQKPKSD